MKLLKSDSAKVIGAKLYSLNYGIGLLKNLCCFRHGHELLLGWLDALAVDEIKAPHVDIPAPLAQALSVWMTSREIDFEVQEA